MQQRQSQFHTHPSSPPSLPVFQQETQSLPATSIPSPITPTPEPLTDAQFSPLIRVRSFSKKGLTRIVAGLLTLLLAGAIVAIWFVPPSASSPSTTITQQSFGPSSQNAGTGTPSGGTLHVYVIGSVRHPGVYTLPAGARVYQLLQAAGGALPQADLVSLNLAAPLTDGQEVYVLTIGETPPTIWAAFQAQVRTVLPPRKTGS